MPFINNDKRKFSILMVGLIFLVSTFIKGLMIARKKSGNILPWINREKLVFCATDLINALVIEPITFLTCIRKFGGSNLCRHTGCPEWYFYVVFLCSTRHVPKCYFRIDRFPPIAANLLTGWLTDWLTGWLTDWMTGWLTHWLTGWLANWLNDWLANWLTDWLAG